jgi:putative oxidoreductase
MSYIQRWSPMWRDLPIDLISRSPIARWAPVPLRLIVGYGFMEHGFAKLARGLDAFPAILQALGVPAPKSPGDLVLSRRGPTHPRLAEVMKSGTNDHRLLL